MYMTYTLRNSGQLKKLFSYRSAVNWHSLQVITSFDHLRNWCISQSVTTYIPGKTASEGKNICAD